MSVLTFAVTEAEARHRLDTIISKRVPGLSRSHAARLIRTGYIVVNHLKQKPAYLVKCGDVVQTELPVSQPIKAKPEPIPLSILYEDADIIILNKPAGVVVYPAPGHRSGTVVNALLYHYQNLEGIESELRPGIVHRLDKDTSGALIVAKNTIAHESLCSQFKERQVQKLYLALVYGNMKGSSGVIKLPIGRHPADRKKMSTKARKTRSTETRWRVKERFQGITLLEVDLRTGRTHQIRVHCAATGHPVVGDTTYGGKRKWKEFRSRQMQDTIRSVPRQMLHAWQVEFIHPRLGHVMHFTSPIPEDMSSVINSLRSIASEGLYL
ncbi:MAG: RluA family pseudouridine synthase [Deltaproteobacteria bacterium]|nr:RluA family pseudouridine synthase [Deltaproteobacteria bacterium]